MKNSEKLLQKKKNTEEDAQQFQYLSCVDLVNVFERGSELSAINEH